MSAVLFPMSTSTPISITKSTAKQQDQQNSKIPVPNSPVAFRRSASLRLKGEPPRFQFSTDHHNIIPGSNPGYKRSSAASPISGRFQQQFQRLQQQQQQQENAAASAPLKRGKSFMERGERGVGGRHGAGPSATSRPQSLSNPNTEHQRGLRGPSQPPLTPQSPASRIRSLSLSLSTSRLNSPRSPSAFTVSPRTPPTSPDVKNLSTTNLDWDTESITSLNSVTSVGSCDHASVARNGTTFSGRSMKYVFHCNQHAGATGEDYLTPTQRVHRQVKKLKYLLHQAKKDLEDKDSDILKLTKEVVELRLYKAALNSPEDKSNSSDAVTVRENTDDQITPDTIDHMANNHEMNNSYTDSGHFDDFSSKDSEDAAKSPFRGKLCGQDKAVSVNLSVDDVVEHGKLIVEYERRLQELVKTHEEETYQLKQRHNDKVEELLQRITEINTRYWELVPELDLAKEKIKELEGQLEEACRKLEQQEADHKKAYLKMYTQGHEAACLENEVKDGPRQGPSSRISVPELLEELQVTKNELENIKDLEYAQSPNSLHPLLSAKEALSLWVLGARKAMYRQLMEAKNKSKIDPEITLQFLKSAIYYFLTDRENSQGHLKAIQSILGFTPSEISNIDKARLS